MGFDPITSGIGLATGLIGGIGKIFSRNKANKELERLKGLDPMYQRSQYAGKQLGIANQLYNGRMFGASDLEKNILSNQANVTGNIDRNATDSSQALALLSGTQGNTNQQFQNLQTQEAQNKYSLLDNLNNAYGVNRQEDMNQYQDSVRRYGDLVSLTGAQSANKAANWGDVGNFGFGVANFGMAGGFGGGKPNTIRKPNYIDYNSANAATGYIGG